MAILGFSVVQACRFTENDVLCEWIAGAKDAHLHTWFQRRGQKPMIHPRDDLFEGRRGQKGRICTRRRACSSGGTHFASLRSALLPSPASSLPRELVSGRHLPLPEAVGRPRPPCCPSVRLLRLHWKMAMKKGGRDFRPPFVCIN